MRVDVRGLGLCWWQRYHGIENCACLTLVLIVLGLPLSLFYAIRKVS